VVRCVGGDNVKRFALLLLIVGLLSWAWAQPPAKIQTLIITGQQNHDWRGTSPVLRDILEKTGKFEVRVTEEFRGAGPETLAPYDVVVLDYCDLGKPELRWGKRAEDALVDFVRSGKGLVIYHYAVAAFDGWQEFERMAGGNWRPNNGQHSAAHDFKVEIKDSDHPITRGLKTSFLQPKDELYANLKWQPAGNYRVLATAWDDHSMYNAEMRKRMAGAGLSQPIFWVAPYGKGRVFTTVLGHDPASLASPAFAVTYARGAEWAATGNVKQAIPPEIAR